MSLGTWSHSRDIREVLLSQRAHICLWCKRDRTNHPSSTCTMHSFLKTLCEGPTAQSLHGFTCPPHPGMHREHPLHLAEMCDVSVFISPCQNGLVLHEQQTQSASLPKVLDFVQEIGPLKEADIGMVTKTRTLSSWLNSHCLIILQAIRCNIGPERRSFHL